MYKPIDGIIFVLEWWTAFIISPNTPIGAIFIIIPVKYITDSCNDTINEYNVSLYFPLILVIEKPNRRENNIIDSISPFTIELIGLVGTK